MALQDRQRHVSVVGVSIVEGDHEGTRRQAAGGEQIRGAREGQHTKAARHQSHQPVEGLRIGLVREQGVCARANTVKDQDRQALRY